ncbi:MAG: glycine--tRNA ligase subunit beta, partial [Caldilineae bacterium]
AADYRPLLAEHGILLDADERRETIRAQLAAAAAEVGGRPADDPALLDEVTNLVEQPTTFLGAFDESHLALPAPVLTTVMKKHQRYFPVLDEAGNLMPYFLGVRNGGTAHLDRVRAGNEGVVIARFADAAFFFKADTTRKLEDFLPRLDTLTFQEKLGSMLDKTRRLETLAPRIGEMVGLSPAERETVARAARLCKADLATQMVVEFTSLQGVMGYEYALRSGEPEAVALAIREHYLPAGAGDPLPATRPGLALSLANRLDSLAGLFAVGLAPSGSADPFALRRDALGLVQILLEKGIDFSVRKGLEEAAARMPVPVTGESLDETAAFVRRRLEGLLRERGFPFDVVAAVLAERGDNPALALAAATDLAEAVQQDWWQTTLDAYARCVRIVRPIAERHTLHPDLLREPAARALYRAWESVHARLTPATPLAGLIAALRDELVGPITTFFDEVLVMTDDETLRHNRLALLQNIRDLTAGYADFSHLQGF